MLTLDNPKQQRTLAEIVASVRDSTRVEVAARIARVDRLIARRNKTDADPPLTNTPKSQRLRKVAHRLKTLVAQGFPRIVRLLRESLRGHE
jgi:hypothetical protein